MTKKLQKLLLVACVAVSGVSLSVPAVAGAAEDAIAAAKAAQKQAGMVGGEWRDTGKMIKKAEKLLAGGKAGEAEKLAQEAEAQGMLGHIQATSQPMGKLHI